MAFPDGWAYRARVVVPAAQIVGGPHDRFPLLIAGASLSNAAHGGHLFAHAAAGGGDIRASLDASGLTPLPVELVYYDAAAQACSLWVRYPQLPDGADAELYLWYGAAAAAPASTEAYGRDAVWTDYDAVWHLAAADGADSTGKGHDLAVSAGAPASAAGPFDGLASAFSGSDYFSAAAVLGGQGDLTLSVWAYRTAGGDAGMIGTVAGGSSDNIELGLRYDASGFSEGGSDVIKYAALGDAGETDASGAFPSNGWQAFQLRRGGTVAAAFIDGASADVGVFVGSASFAASALYVGTGAKAGWQGRLAEARLRASALSGGWIATEYANQSDPGAFAAAAAAEATPGAGAIEAAGAADLSPLAPAIAAAFVRAARDGGAAPRLEPLRGGGQGTLHQSGRAAAAVPAPSAQAGGRLFRAVAATALRLRRSDREDRQVRPPQAQRTRRIFRETRR